MDDPKDFLADPIDEHYMVSKALEGSKLENLVDSIYHPGKGMNSVTRTDNAAVKPATVIQKTSTILLLVLIAGIAILVFVAVFFK